MTLITKCANFGVFICLSGMIILYFFVNTLTLLLTFFTFVGYTILYTVILKHLTPQNIVIGGASGAMPPVLGWTAIQNGITFEPLVLFLIIFIWTPPHFGLLLYIEKTIMRKLVFPCYLLLMVVILQNYIISLYFTIVYSIFITFFNRYE